MPWSNEIGRFDAATINAALEGFTGVWGSGSHVYFCPYYNGSYHGNVLRYDVSGSFADSSSWEYFDAATITSALKGFWGVWGSGSHVYFSPDNNGSRHGNVLRYDVSGSFTDSASWEYFDAATITSALKGFKGVWATGSHLYFSPYDNGSPHGNVLRYDLSGSFSDSASWEYFNAATIASALKGFYAVWGSGSHVYFCPYDNGSRHGNVLRYDLSGSFSDSASWEYFNAATIASALKGFIGVWGNASHVYFCPYNNGSRHGNVLRYDLSGSFTDSASWEYFDAASVNAALIGFHGVWGSGSHVYFSPRDNGSPHGNVLRYDVSGSFADSSSWEYFDAATINSALKGFYGTWGSASHVYFCPYNNGSPHGNAMRLALPDIALGAASFGRRGILTGGRR